MRNLSVLRGVVLLVWTSTTLSVAAAGKGPVVITQDSALLGGVSGSCDAPGFPVTICKRGSYVLGSNLTVPAGKDGIDIAVPDVFPVATPALPTESPPLVPMPPAT